MLVDKGLRKSAINALVQASQHYAWKGEWTESILYGDMHGHGYFTDYYLRCSYNMMFMRIGMCIRIAKGVSRKRSNGRESALGRESTIPRTRLPASNGNLICKTVV